MNYYLVESIRRGGQIVFGWEVLNFPVLCKLRVLFYRAVFDIGENPIIEHNVRLYRVHGKKNGSVKIGKNVLFASGVSLDYSGTLIIEDDVWLSSEVNIHTHYHKVDDQRVQRNEQDILPTKIRIGEKAWIGSRAIILPGVSCIGKNSIVGAGSVVTKNVPDNVAVAGNPARVIKNFAAD